ncbi:MAG: hypothetical protein MJB57_10485 [Gemmatimonadetes bacterium]|nr:hypothetical protein [Gemmatimonadota bacterium]
MRIEGPGPDSTRPTGPRSVEQASKDEVRAKKKASAASVSGDRIEISEAGRAAAARLAEPGAVDAESLSVERVEEIRARVEAGVYDTPEIREEVVRRILDAGDLDAPAEDQ